MLTPRFRRAGWLRWALLLVVILSLLPVGCGAPVGYVRERDRYRRHSRLQSAVRQALQS